MSHERFSPALPINNLNLLKICSDGCNRVIIYIYNKVVLSQPSYFGNWPFQVWNGWPHTHLLQNPGLKNLLEFKWYLPDKFWDMTLEPTGTAVLEYKYLPNIKLANTNKKHSLWFGKCFGWLKTIVFRKPQLFPVKTFLDKQYTNVYRKRHVWINRIQCGAVMTRSIFS